MSSISNNLSRSVSPETQATVSVPPNPPENKSEGQLFSKAKLNIVRKKWTVKTVTDDHKLSNWITEWTPGEAPPRQAESPKEISSAELKRQRLLKKTEMRKAIKTRVTHWTPRDIPGNQAKKSRPGKGNNAQSFSSERAQQAAISILQAPAESERLEIASPLIPCAPLRTSLLMLDYHEVLSIGRQLLQYLATKESIDEILTPYNLMYDPRLRYLTISPSVPNQTEMTCYHSPEIILKGPIDVSANVWSLGCTLFKLFTGETLFPIHDRVYFVAKNTPMQPYLRTDLPISSNELLQRMQMQIGLPTKEFLAKCQDAPKYYYIREDQIHFHWYLAIKDLPWRDSILNAAANRGITPSEVFPLIQLLDGMLRYENRPSPQELLCSPLFQQRFSLNS